MQINLHKHNCEIKKIVLFLLGNTKMIQELKMKCPNCGMDDDRVIDSRSVKEGYGVRRRRVCNSCQHRFTTQESIIRSELLVVKRNDAIREEFDRDKLRRGIENACYKRPVSADQIDAVVDELVSGVMHDFDKEVSSAELGARVMIALKQVDQVAYVRFASVYRKFKDVEEFIEEIRMLR